MLVKLKVVLVVSIFLTGVAISSEVHLPAGEFSTTPACTVHLTTQTGSPQPLYIRPGTNQFFRPENRAAQLRFDVNQEIEMFCSDSFDAIPGAQNLIRASCVSGQTFRFQNTNFLFNQFRCRSWPVWTARRTSTRCFGNGILVEVGYAVESRWMNVYTVCHDLTLETNWYVQYKLGVGADASQGEVRRIDWTQAGGFFTNQNVNGLYNVAQQRRTIATILADQQAADNFILPDPTLFFMARGHLGAMRDFILATEQLATFHFLNAAPQWQTFNEQNWLAVELSSRRLAATRAMELDVYTGTFGIGHLWDRNGTRSEIFFDWPAGRIPMPMLYYKVLVNQAGMTGVVLIGVNNPYLTLDEINRLGYIVCPDVSDQISYMTWRRTDLIQGYGYACEIHEFLRTVPHIPELGMRSYRLLV